MEEQQQQNTISNDPRGGSVSAAAFDAAASRSPVTAVDAVVLDLDDVVRLRRSQGRRGRDGSQKKRKSSWGGTANGSGEASGPKGGGVIKPPEPALASRLCIGRSSLGGEGAKKGDSAVDAAHMKGGLEGEEEGQGAGVIEGAVES